MDTTYDDSGARAALAPSGIEPPALPAYFDRLIEYALRAEWGRRPVPRHHLLAPSHPRAQHREGRVHRRAGRSRPTSSSRA
jgi:hypothetical protein